MIVVETPLRLSFLGGGTDFEDFYLKHSGAVISTTINKCVYVIVKERFDNMCKSSGKMGQLEDIR